MVRKSALIKITKKTAITKVQHLLLLFFASLIFKKNPYVLIEHQKSQMNTFKI